MSPLPTPPLSSILGASAAATFVPRARPANAGAPTFSVPKAASDTTPASPPPEVHDAIAVAAQAADRLAQSGRALRFDADEAGHVTVHVTDASGTVLHTISGAQALAIASGAPFT